MGTTKKLQVLSLRTYQYPFLNQIFYKKAKPDQYILLNILLPRVPINPRTPRMLVGIETSQLVRVIMPDN